MQNPRQQGRITKAFLKENCVFPTYARFLNIIDKAMAKDLALREDILDGKKISYAHIPADESGIGLACDVFVAGDYEKLVRLSDGRSGEPGQILLKEDVAPLLPVLEARLKELYKEVRRQCRQAMAVGEHHWDDRYTGVGNLTALVHMANIERELDAQEPAPVMAAPSPKRR